MQGVFMQPTMSFSEIATKPQGGSRWNFALLVGVFSEKNWLGQVISQSYDVIRGAASNRFFKDIVFLATLLAAIDRNENIMHGLGQEMTTPDLWHCILTF